MAYLELLTLAVCGFLVKVESTSGGIPPQSARCSSARWPSSR